MNELPKHLKYNPAPEIVRAHEQWQSALRQTVSQLQSMGHVRAPEAISNTVIPLFVHLDGLFTLLQADVAAYAEQVMALSQDASSDTQVLVGLHPQDAEALADLTDQIYASVEKVRKGLKKDSPPHEQLAGVLQMVGDLQEAIMSASLEEDEVPADEDEDVPPGEEVPAPSSDAPDDDLSDTPLQITG